ncbi:MAG: hypothetical protein GYA23_04755 [Methanomicrobiales archaeon]|nr:hypothetical protein [Methanomicrobiales archaeon]
MASSDPMGLYIFGFVLLLFIGVIVYAHVQGRLTANKRKQLIRAFKASLNIEKNAPILVQGRAVAPDLILPTTGEHVAYYGIFVMSRESAITDTRTTSGIRINGIPLGNDGMKIDSLEGFMFFESGGDFTITSGGVNRTVRVSGVFAYFKKGADLVSGFVAGQFKSAGLPEEFFNDIMQFKVAEQALKMLCGFDAPLVTARTQRRSGSWNRTTTTQRSSVSVVSSKASIDTRVHHFVSGFNLPAGIMELITKRKIELPEKEEIIAVEVFIPLNREIFVFGTFDGEESIIYADSTTRLSVSYTDPEFS